MAHEVETMAYAGEMPWHGLGANVDANSSVEEMALAAGLSWKLEPRDVLVDLGDKVVKEPSKIAWVRDQDRKIMTISSPEWRPLQPADTLGFMRNYVDAGAATLETAGSLREGKIVWGLARLNHSFEPVRGDRVNGYLLIVSPNEVGKAITIRTTTVRVVCANTMAFAMKQGTTEFRQTHLRDFDVMSAKEAVGRAHENLARAERNARVLAKMKLSVDEALMKVLLPSVYQNEPDMLDEDTLREIAGAPEAWPKKIAGIVEAIERGPGQKEIAGTGWAVINGVTRWTDHVYGHSAATRMARAWLGDHGEFKLDVEARLLELADAD